MVQSKISIEGECGVVRKPNNEGGSSQELKTCSLRADTRKLMATIGKSVSVARLEQTSDCRPRVGMSQSQHIQAHKSLAA